MAGRILNRRELRRHSDQAEQAKTENSDVVATVAPPKATVKRKSGAAAKVRKPRKSKAKPRMRALWCIYDGGMKEVALFDYNRRAAAEEKLATLLSKPKGVYFLQIVKQPMPESEPVETPSVV